jgi:hypothetical protein
VFERFCLLGRACLNGVWLGLLGRDRLHAIDRAYYDLNAHKYCDREWNARGLFNWERRAVEQYFRDCRALLVGSIGGGRELIALTRLGYEVDGFECHPELCECARTMARAENLSSTILLSRRDHCPLFPRIYDGLIVGWGAYMLIQGRQRRVEFLQELKSQATAGALILISFHVREPDSRHFHVVSVIATALRWLRRADRPELGDDLAPTFVHHFTEPEIAAELDQAGFNLEYFSSEPYGHAVGVVRPVVEATSSPKDNDASHAFADVDAERHARAIEAGTILVATE